MPRKILSKINPIRKGNISSSTSIFRDMPKNMGFSNVVNGKIIVGEIRRFLKKEFSKRKKTLAIVGVSGGVDSSLAARLCETAGLRVKKVFMPYGEISKKPHGDFLKIDITKAADILSGRSSNMVNKGNIMARARMIILYDLARKLNGLVVGTENLSEYYLGYFTLHGDQACDINPIAGLWKTQAIELAKYLELPIKEPSAELWEGQTDAKELGFSYQEADPILYFYCVKKWKPARIIRELDLNGDLVYKVVERVKNTEYKREAIPRYERI